MQEKQAFFAFFIKGDTGNSWLEPETEAGGWNDKGGMGLTKGSVRRDALGPPRTLPEQDESAGSKKLRQRFSDTRFLTFSHVLILAQNPEKSSENLKKQ